MKNRKSGLRIALLIALGLTLALIAVTGSAEYNMGEWVVTQDAQDRTDAGDCAGTGLVCKQRVDDNGPTSEFRCMPVGL